MQTEFQFNYDGKLLAGVDEVGRGPLAGPVVAAAVILDENKRIEGLLDSKMLTEKKRSQLAVVIKERSLSWGIGRAEFHEIDEINILQASLLAMSRAVDAMKIAPEFALVDGNHCPQLSCQVVAVIKGDQLVPAISAASIIAKVERDREMIEMDRIYPGYGFSRHKGYPTKQHLQALQELGICAIHRLSYGPVKRIGQANCG